MGDFRLGCAWLGRFRLGRRDGQRRGLNHGHDFRFGCGRFRRGLFGGRLNDHDFGWLRLRLRLGHDLRDDRLGLHLLFWLRLNFGDGLRLGGWLWFRLRDWFGLEIFLEFVCERPDCPDIIGILVRHEVEVAVIRLQRGVVLLHLLPGRAEVVQGLGVFFVEFNGPLEMNGGVAVSLL